MKAVKWLDEHFEEAIIIFLLAVITIVVDIITAAALGILAYASLGVIGTVQASGAESPAMEIPLWIMYVIIFIGFALGVARSIEMCVIHIKNINVPPVNSVEAAAADAIYFPLMTQLLQDAEAKGCQVVTGIGMMNEQAAVGEKIWFGVDMPIDEVTAELNA